MEELKQKDPYIKDIDLKNDENECQMCKFVFASALIGVFFVIIFTHFLK